MRILFSADWHLGFTLGGPHRVGRLGDQLRQIRRITQYIDEYDVDVLAIAGDVFEAQDRGAALAAVEGMIDVLRPPLARGLKLIAIAGNHDRDYFMDTANVWMSVETGEGGGRVYFRTRPELLTLSARGESVNFALLPYPTRDRYDVRHDDAGGTPQLNQRVAAVYINEMERLQQLAATTRLPTVLITHVTIEGHSVHAHRLSPRDDVTIPRGRFPEFELTVSGHIHKAERIGGGHFYYIGALDRMDAGERDYQPRVLLADIGPAGLREIHSLPLDPTPVEVVSAGSEDELEAAAGFMRRRDETLVKLRLRVPFGTFTAPLIDRARQLFPRLYGSVDYDWLDQPQAVGEAAGLDPADVPGTVRWYLEQQGLDSEELSQLLELVDELRREDVAP